MFWEKKLEDVSINESKKEHHSITTHIYDPEAPSEVYLANLAYNQIFLKNVEQDTELSTLERIVLTGRAQGKKIVEILRDIKKARKKCHRETARLIIRRFEYKWGIRSWSLKQMYPKAGVRTQSFHTHTKSFQIHIRP